jgi:hypothetical protein
MTTETKHTPGPWTNINGTNVRSADGTTVCKGILTESNARLIAAAPDLLAALQTFSWTATEHPPCFCPPKNGRMHTDQCDAARAAIAKATGAVR